MEYDHPHLRARSIRRIVSQLIFAWGAVLSTACYALLTVLGSPPLLDDHITATAISMLGSYLLFRCALDLWLSHAEARRRSQ